MPGVYPGSDIYFNSGKFDMNNNSGKHLLAHELTSYITTNRPCRFSGTKKFPLPKWHTNKNSAITKRERVDTAQD
jgi:hypothetical protein